ncbi:hypothetical protein HMPREF0063_10106 [Aeromicrobium marinum DSM 15272]|uniref:Iron-containing redox enzyme n=1 Tax=Aeromicrobium marinum DSM 15272 TaxID=585531 RepID=E2S7U9_9ACTN|nr:iron-containing redox enzyme family protein [Aeromicrobium marinum]EFQ84765.1 hypothetical protein HMPREF0063_10106 [Aeromicrobium marinum DSM 15272]
MRLPDPCGRLTGHLFPSLRSDGRETAVPVTVEPDSTHDEQLALWVLYELHYRGFDDVSAELEWEPWVLTVRQQLEASFEQRLRSTCVVPDGLDPAAPVGETLFALVDAHPGTSVAAHVGGRADLATVEDLLRQRSLYHLKESDPVAWSVPRLPPAAQARLMELQFDEYGAGDPDRLHASLFARGLRQAGLDDAYGAYVGETTVEALEQNNAMSLFGLHRRHLGAAMGHLAAFEASSSLPSRRMAKGLRRVGITGDLAAYYDEHVEADAVHEQLAARGICGALVAEQPELAPDVLWGAQVCLDLEHRFAEAMLSRWAAA